MRDTADDEDGPPTAFVTDLINDVHKDTYSSKPKVSRSSVFANSYV